MSIFYAVRNLTEQTITPCIPWEFQPPKEISAQVRGSKQDRQMWYRTKSTEHNFYTAVEPANPNIRPSKENPPRAIHGFVADFDLPIPDQRLDEAVNSLSIKPAWIERSLGGNARLVWTFPHPLLVDGVEFATSVLEAAEGWLGLSMLPGLDGPAFRDPHRLYCNGSQWRATGHGPIDSAALQSFFVKAGQSHRFNGPENGVTIPLDVVEKELKDKYPSFTWPGEFALDTQGPSFWISASVSPLSAMLKPEGMFTFSAHAEKPFYTWADILGPEFVRKYAEQSIAKATTDIFWDGKRFWRRKNGYFASMDMTELLNHFKVNCRLSAKPGKDGQSQTDQALNHIFIVGHISGAAPFLFRPSGILDFLGKRVLNTYINKVMKPAESDGPTPFLDAHFDNLFDPPEQKWHFLAWFKHYYISALQQMPMPGQNIFLMGGANVGKTFTMRGVVALAVGGFVDAADFLVHGGQFNSELFEAPLWCIDDETPGDSANKQAYFAAVLKKTTANQQFKHNKKFEVACMVEWMGRVSCTTNLDYVSSRMLGPMDNTSMDKTCLFKCVKDAKVEFPKRYELTQIINTELPFFLRKLLAMEFPAYVIPDVRFGYRAWHEPTLLDQSHQSSRVAPFKELLIESLGEHFATSPEEKEWRGTVTQLIRLITSNPLNDHVMRSLRLEQVSRYLEQIQREGLFRCTVITGDLNTRIWVFFAPEKKPPAAPAQIEAPKVVTIFSK